MNEITAYITVKFEGSLPSEAVDPDGLLDAIRNELEGHPGIEFRSAGIELREGWDDDDPSRPMVPSHCWKPLTQAGTDGFCTRPKGHDGPCVEVSEPKR